MTASERIYIVARNQREAEDYALVKRIRDRARYICRVEEAYSIGRGSTVHMVGRWFERSDAGEIQHVLNARGVVLTDCFHWR